MWTSITARITGHLWERNGSGKAENAPPKFRSSTMSTPPGSWKCSCNESRRHRQHDSVHSFLLCHPERSEGSAVSRATTHAALTSSASGEKRFCLTAAENPVKHTTSCISPPIPQPLHK